MKTSCITVLFSIVMQLYTDYNCILVAKRLINILTKYPTMMHLMCCVYFIMIMMIMLTLYILGYINSKINL